jgi:CRISPR/Cas system-associated endoribonuclease Cas2
LTSPGAAGSGGWPAAARTTGSGYKEWVVLKSRLLREADTGKDSLRFYFLDGAAVDRVEHYGVREPRDLAEPLVI